MNFATPKSVGSNAHENWTLLRLLPLMVGLEIPEGDPAWEVFLCSETLLSLLQTKSTQRRPFASWMQCIIPKHHFLEHYPELIRAYGPLVSLWTMRFEAKHSFFKRVVRHTRSFRNIVLSLTMKHQLLLAYDQHDSRVVRPLLQATTLSTVDVCVLREDI